MLAPTGVATVNVNGNTIHSSLGIPDDRGFAKNISRLGDKKRSILRNKLRDVCVLIIDEISMVSNKLLLHIHQRLTEIFGCSPDIPFPGLSIIACGDFYQLPPILARPVFENYDVMLNISHCWRYFKIAELTEVMRQRGDQRLIKLLNNIRLGVLDENDEQMLKSRFISTSDSNYPKDNIHIWAENKPVSDHISRMLKIIDFDVLEVRAIDKIPENIPNLLIDSMYNKSQVETSGLADVFIFKINAKVMLTCNIDVSDKLSNGQIGTVYHTKTNTCGNISKIYIKMEDSNAGLNAMRADRFAIHHNVVPIEKVEKEIKFNKNSPSSPVMKRIQFPLMLAWACTIHKVQGKTFSKIVVSFDLIK